jgi:hypothetical protein
VPKEAEDKGPGDLLLMERKSVLQLPGNLNQSSSLRIVFGFIDFSNSLLQAEKSLF